MTIIKKKNIRRGLRIKPDDVAFDGNSGEIKIGTTSKEMEVYLDGAARTVVTEDQIQILTNKTIDADNSAISNLEVDNLKAGVLNTSTALSGASDTQVPSALAVKTYVDDGLALQNQASEITIDAIPGLTATNVQEALEEIDTNVDTVTSGLASHISNPTGSHAASSISNTPSGNLSATNVQSALNELQTDVDTRATSSALTAHTGASTGVHGVAGAIVGTTDSQTLTTKTIVVANNTITTAASGNLAATELNAALSELQTDIDTRATSTALTAEISRATTAEALVQTNLTTHINNTTGAHAGSAISNTPSGNLAATTVQGALNELQTDVDTRATSTALDAHINNTTGAHAASAISNTASGNLTSTNVQASLVELQTDIDTRALQSALTSEASTRAAADITLQTNIDAKAAGAASSTDNHLARFDGTTGKIIQDGSTAVLSDAGALSGLTALTVDNVVLDGDTITDGTSSINLGSSNVVTTGGTITNTGGIVNTTTTNSTSGGSATITVGNFKNVILTNPALTSISMISATSTSGQEVTLINRTGVTVVINNLNGGAAANQILTGTSAAVNLPAGGTFAFVRDSTGNNWTIVGGTGSGSGSQSLDTFVQLFGQEDTSTWSTGDSSTFMGGGTLSGTFGKETGTPLNGTASYLYTQAAGSVDDYLASPLQSVPIRFRGNQASIIFPYKYNGANTDIAVVVYDVTNSAKLTDDTQNLLPATGLNAGIYKANVVIPLTCTQIRVGFHVKALNSGKNLDFDDIQVGSDTTKYAAIANITSWQNYIPTFTGFGSVTIQDFRWRQVGESVEIEGRFTSGVSTAVEARISLPNSYTSVSSYVTLEHTGTWIQNGVGAVSTYTTIEPSVQYLTLSIQSASAGALTKMNGNTALGSGQAGSFKASVKCAGLTASNSQIITAADTFSTDTASLVYAGSATYTASTLVNAPVGTFITYTIAGSTTDTQTQTTTAPTQTTSSMNANGIQIFKRNYAALSTAGNPVKVFIQIGKGMKGVSISGYASTGKVQSISLDAGQATSSIQLGFTLMQYNEVTGILILDAGSVYSSAFTNNVFYADNGSGGITSVTSCYVVVNVSRNPALVGIGSGLYNIRAVNTSGTSIANSGDTKIALDASATIANNMSLDTVNNRILAPVAGTYEVSGAIQFSSQLYAAGNTAELRLYKNGVYYSTIGHMIMEVASSQVTGVSGVRDLVQLSVGDYIEFFANNNRTAGATALLTTAGANFFNVSKLGGLS